MLDNYQRVEEVLAGFAQGEIVAVTDDDDRENEGDLFVAASRDEPHPKFRPPTMILERNRFTLNRDFALSI